MYSYYSLGLKNWYRSFFLCYELRTSWKIIRRCSNSASDSLPVHLISHIWIFRLKNKWCSRSTGARNVNTQTAAEFDGTFEFFPQGFHPSFSFWGGWEMATSIFCHNYANNAKSSSQVLLNLDRLVFRVLVIFTMGAGWYSSLVLPWLFFSFSHSIC